MLKQKENKLTWCLSAVAMFVAYSSVLFNETWSEMSDVVFLYNRCYQLFDCLRHGLWPFIYYEDLGGIGYGSPIFYGQLTLLPFMPFLGSISSFLKVYSLCSILLNFFGFRHLAKRFSSYATLTACFYIISMPFLGLFNGSLPAFCFAGGISLFFLGYCVNYFRDYKNLYLLILTYFLTWQSNLQAVILSTVACFFVFCVYFKLQNWKNYIKLFVGVLCLVLFDIANIIVNFDAFRFVDASVVLNQLSPIHDIRMFSIHPLGGYVFRGMFPIIDYCNGFMTFGVFAVFVYFMINGFSKQSLRFKVTTCVGVGLTVVGYILSTFDIWHAVYSATNIFIQFPARYFIYLFVFILVLLSRVIQPKTFVYVAVIFCVLDVVISHPFHPRPDEGVTYTAMCLMNAEYSSNDFILDDFVIEEYSNAVHSESGVVYSFERSYNMVSVDCSANPGVDVLTLPKLYYNGYQAVGSTGETFIVRGGYSNYCEVDIGSYQGTLTLSYKIPAIVYWCFILQILCFCVVGINVWYDWRSAHESAKRN